MKNTNPTKSYTVTFWRALDLHPNLIENCRYDGKNESVAHVYEYEVDADDSDSAHEKARKQMPFGVDQSLVTEN